MTDTIRVMSDDSSGYDRCDRLQTLVHQHSPGRVKVYKVFYKVYNYYKSEATWNCSKQNQRIRPLNSRFMGKVGRRFEHNNETEGPMELIRFAVFRCEIPSAVTGVTVVSGPEGVQ